MDNEMLRIVTYNVLSSYLAPKYIICTTGEQIPLNNSIRLEKIELEIIEIAHGKTRKNGKYCYDPQSEGPIFLLQEVSLEFVGILTKLFDRIDYKFIPTNYGNPQNGYMGVATAFPSKYYNLEEVIIDVPNAYNQQAVEKALSFSGINSRCYPVSKNGTIPEYDCEIDMAKEAWIEALKIQNRMIMVKLSRGNFKFWVSNYHMPCAYKNKIKMTICTLLYFQKIQKIAKNQILIAGGDFNLHVDADQYKMMVDPEFVVNPSVKIFSPEGWKPDFLKMKVSEPLNFTVNTVGGYSGKSFIGSIDHFFYSNIILYEVEDVEYPEYQIPNEDYPSDHIPVIVKFVIQDG